MPLVNDDVQNNSPKDRRIPSFLQTLHQLYNNYDISSSKMMEAVENCDGHLFSTWATEIARLSIFFIPAFDRALCFKLHEMDGWIDNRSLCSRALQVSITLKLYSRGAGSFEEGDHRSMVQGCQKQSSSFGFRYCIW